MRTNPCAYERDHVAVIGYTRAGARPWTDINELSYNLGELQHVRELRLRATPGPAPGCQISSYSYAWKILPISNSYDSYNVQHLPLGFLFTIYLQIIKKLKLDFFQKI